jgi:hypothetical protein
MSGVGLLLCKVCNPPRFVFSEQLASRSSGRVYYMGQLQVYQ